VLEQQAGVRDLTADPLLMDLALEIPCVQVIDCRIAEADAGEDQVTIHGLSLCRPACVRALAIAARRHNRLVTMYRVD